MKIRRDEYELFDKKTGNIDVRQLMKKHSIEELNQAAENYFSRLEDWTYHLVKPLTSPEEAAMFFTNFAHLIMGLKIMPYQTVLDFGAGSCWTSKYLAQLKLKVIALDISKTALKIGQELFKISPPIGDYEKPEFLNYDAVRIPLENESVDRVFGMDAFHHVANPGHTLKELYRILKTDGIVGFSEPGPNQSQSKQAQSEMKEFRVVENDIIIQEIWQQANDAGFDDIKIAVLNPTLHLLSIEDFNKLLSCDINPAVKQGTSILKKLYHSFSKFFRSNTMVVDNNCLITYANFTQNAMQDKRIFFLYKGKPLYDSRIAGGLVGEIKIKIDNPKVNIGDIINGMAMVTNSSQSIYLPSDAEFGPVNIGVHLLDENRYEIERDYYRVSLSSGKSIYPGENVSCELKIPAPNQSGTYYLEFDLVSEFVCWFANNGSKTISSMIKVQK